MTRKDIPVIVLIFLLAACSTRPAPPDGDVRLNTYYDKVDGIAAAGANELKVSVIGVIRSQGWELPVHLFSRAAIGEGAGKILVLSDSGGSTQISAEIILETARQLVTRPEFYGNVTLDLISIAVPPTDLNRKTFDRSERNILRHFLRTHDYDLVILHQVNSEQVGFSIIQKGMLQDEAAFALSRVRDNGFFVAGTSRNISKKTFRKGGLPDLLLRQSGAVVMVFRSGQNEEKEKTVFQHLLAQETVTRLLMKNFYR
ncbi:hypothetical protein [Emcibacter sp.]|uniref:hypothetical protein n=1 Tax=Emcibacter sp. TaxID=1979954 RepID=UPI002AA67155|nr:hypothetical protein [Emcibacter sp.]